jgi:SAM-dependent methyltransferase
MVVKEEMDSGIAGEVLQTITDSENQALHMAIYAWGAKAISSGWVLDLGSEYGFGSSIIAEANSRLRILSIDIDFPALQISKDLHKSKHLIHVNASAGMLPVPDDSICGIFLVSLLHLVDQPSVVLSEVARILKPGGIAVIGIPSEHYFPEGKNRPFFVRQLESEIISLFATAYHPNEISVDAPSDAPSSKGQKIIVRNFDDMWIRLCRKGNKD